MVAFLLAALLSLPGAGQAPEARFSERAFVTAIDVVTEVRDARGETPRDLTSADFRLLENGVERKIIAVEYLDPSPRPAPGARAPQVPPGEAPRPEWQIVVWFDAMTMSRATLSRSARELGERAPDLLRFGPVTVVHSDIAAEVLVDGTRDPRALENALEMILKRPPGDRIAKIRREFLAAADAVTETSLGPPGSDVIKMGAVDRQIPGYVAEEERLLGIARTNLFRWLERIPRRMPRMLVYVGDGFDLDPASFYIDVLQASGDATVDVNQLRSEIKTKTSEASDELARRLAVGGWTALTIGGRNTNFAQDVTRGPLSGRQTGVPAPFLFMNPGDPLIQLAEETGGERIADAGALPGALADIGRRVRITYQVSREPDPRPRRVEIVPLRAGLTVRAPEWVSSTTTEGVAEARAIDLLTGGSARGDLGVGAALLPAGESGTPAIEARVDFGPLSGAAPQIGPTKLRITVAIELPGEPAMTFHRIVEVADLAAVPGIVWSAPINLPESAGSIAVVAEELATGSWGGARVGDAAATRAAVAAAPAVPSSTSFAAPARLSRSEAFARAAAERKLALAFEWDEKCRLCGEIYDRARGNPEVARRMATFVVVGPAPPDPPAEARVALYDPSGRLFLSWPAIGSRRPGQPLSPGDLTVILQRAAAATPHLLRAHDLLANGEEIDARLAVAFAYQDAGDAARAESEYAEAARVATARGDASKAQSARVLGSLMAANQDRAEDALKELRAIAASPSTPLNEAEAHLVTAMILRAQKRDKEAASLLERVLALAPKDSAAHQAALSLTGGPGVAELAAAEGSAPRPLQLVIGGRPPYSGKTRVQVIVRDPAVSSVAFRADGAKEIADATPPFEATIDLGATPRRREIRAVARDAR
ncbi:MAG TPA: hypothetical protein VLV48_05945, partial [Thermoanaerobaculia bacterium]|nr:hypothetical protein [Thermoanaerobaculia bacterium]